MNKPSVFSNFQPSGQSYKPSKPAKMSESEFNFLRAYLNGSHDNNYMNCGGCPTGASTDTVVRHSVASYTTNMAAIGSLVITGMPDAPIIAMPNASAGGSVTVTPYANMPFAQGTMGTFNSDYFKIHGVGGYRAVSLAVKVEDLTPALYRKGTILAVRNPSAIDIVPISNSVTPFFPYNVRVVEQMAKIPSDITEISSNYYQGNSEAGLYAVLPYLNPLNPFIMRDGPRNKAVYTNGIDQTNVNSISTIANVLGYKVGGSNGLNIANHSGVSTVSVMSAGAIAVHPENMQSLMILGNGLDPVNTVWRVTVVSTWEFITSVGSDWADLNAKPPPAALDILCLAAEVFRGMPAAYPASANNFNEIWDRFKSVYNQYVSPIATKVISNLPPNYAGPAAAIKGLIDQVTQVQKEIKKDITETKKAIAAVPTNRR